MQKLGCVSLHCDYRMLLPQQVRAVRDAGYWLLCWTVNDPGDRARAVRLGRGRHHHRPAGPDSARFQLAAPDYKLLQSPGHPPVARARFSPYGRTSPFT